MAEKPGYPALAGSFQERRSAVSIPVTTPIFPRQCAESLRFGYYPGGVGGGDESHHRPGSALGSLNYCIATSSPANGPGR
jgi:hypothetical protein